MAIKILVISSYHVPVAARPEAEVFIGLKKYGFEINVMTYADAEYVENFKKAGIKVIDFHPEKKFDKQEIRRIREQLIEGNYDILHLFNSKAIVNGIRAAKGLPVKVVLYRGYAGNIHWWDPTAYIKYLHPRVDKIICNSKGVEDYIQKQLFFNKSKTITINKGHRPEWYSGVIPVRREELGISDGTFIVTCVANTRRMKGIPFLLKAMFQIPSEMPIHLLLIGHGLDSKNNKKLVEKNKNKDKIHFMGYRENSLNIVASGDVFILSSIYGESITKSVIEAMSVGITPVITDIPGNKELVVHEESGLVVPSHNSTALAEALIRLYNDRELCKKLAHGAQKHIAENLHNDRTVIETKALYEDLVQGIK